MSETMKVTVGDIEVPDGMLSAACYGPGGDSLKLKRALLWLAKNPIVPSHEELIQVLKNSGRFSASASWTQEDVPVAIEVWQRRIFLRREPELPAEVKALMVTGGVKDTRVGVWTTEEAEIFNEAVAKAYALGASSRKAE